MQVGLPSWIANRWARAQAQAQSGETEIVRVPEPSITVHSWTGRTGSMDVRELATAGFQRPARTGLTHTAVAVVTKPGGS
ncbi:hypothetical protein N7539_003045 [Penicillium diatomitis]|uniref:Uncharacterized protein n=1 Tax=Penicillium diatomitis TaxID=2819901 RepID=A0A9W9XGJ5_9EURO|nr:uncharacterized protein N7539_003045 [Penicillium diatomitis]KAJ5491478.1 hypothetical protein N7539_003045 [Penicillium diatomitis]